jgi:hypothetical protein
MIFPLIFFNHITETPLPVRNVFLKSTDVIPHFTEGIPLGDAESRMAQIVIFLHRLMLRYNRSCLFEILNQAC